MANTGIITSEEALKNRIEDAQFALPLTHHFNTPKIFDTTLLDLDKHNDLLYDIDIENPFDELVMFMARPENFWYTCHHILNIDLVPFQLCILYELWTRKFPMMIGVRGMGKTFLLALYAILRGIFNQGCRVVLVGAAFRQSKLVFEFMENIWNNAPIFQYMINKDRSKRDGPRRDIDRCTFKIGHSEALAIPLGSGEKIRGLRSNFTLADEFSSIPLQIFEVVVRGFTSTASNPQDKVREIVRAQIFEEEGFAQEADDIRVSAGFGNQIVVSGTASFSFNHFYEYWKRYRSIIDTQGDKHKLEELFMGEIPDKFDWRHYSVMRIPYNAMPEGFLDGVQIAQAKATMQRSTFGMEYGAQFQKDTEGFFRRTLIESCVASDLKPIQLPSGPVYFSASITGNPNSKYVYGIDPASESDNFAIVILEVCEDHKRIIYCWTANRQSLRDRLKKQGIADEKSYYNYCARKIRILLTTFPSSHIGIDTQGGGITIMEALHDNDLLFAGELPIWPYIKHGKDDSLWWEKEEKPTDGQAGLHILHMVQFANQEFMMQANHGLRQDFESKTTLFPFFDSAEIGLAIEADKHHKREYDTLEDCVMEIEALKDELTTIVHDQTIAGRDRWDTPEIRKIGGKIGRVRKDRYTALIIANQIARLLNNPLKPPAYPVVGGYVGQEIKKGTSGRLYNGPEHIVSKMFGVYGAGVYHLGNE